jgi:GntR family transcriptional regulator
MSKFLEYVVDVDSPVAVYVQIQNQVKFAIASGKIGAGDTLPSIREMSSLLDVNPNTITKAYRDLEMMSLVTTRRGVGVTVADKALKLCKAQTMAMVKDSLADAVAECVACGLGKGEIRNIVTETIDAGTLPYAGAGKN